MHRPIRPRPILCSGSGSAWMTGGCSIFSLSEPHLDRLATGLQRLEVELDLDGNVLASQILGYSP
jgi:hypothetical protein